LSIGATPSWSSSAPCEQSRCDRPTLLPTLLLCSNGGGGKKRMLKNKDQKNRIQFRRFK
jgi:hypothetical protein